MEEEGDNDSDKTVGLEDYPKISLRRQSKSHGGFVRNAAAGMEEGGASDSDKTVRLENYHWQPETMPLRRLTEEHLSQNIATAPNGCETTPNAYIPSYDVRIGEQSVRSRFQGSHFQKLVVDSTSTDNQENQYSNSTLHDCEVNREPLSQVPDDVQNNTRHTDDITIVIDSSDDEDAFEIDCKPDEKVDEKKYPSTLNIPETIKNGIELGDLELTANDVPPPIINVNIQPIRIKVLNPKTINEQAAAKICSEVSNDDNNKLNNDIVSSTRSSDGESMDNLIKDLTTLCKPYDTVYAPTSNENVSSSSVIHTVAINTRDKISESSNKNCKETANPKEDNARNIKVNTTETVAKSSSAERIKLLSPENSMGEKGNRHVESNKLLNINAEETRGQVNRLPDKNTLPTTCQRMRTNNEEPTKNTLHSVGNNDDKVHTNNRLNTSILDLCTNTHQKNGQNTDIVINEQKEKETSKTQNLKEFVKDNTSRGDNLKNLNEKKIISKFLSRFCSDIVEHLLEKWTSLSEDAENKNAFLKSARLLGDEIQKLDTLEKADVQLNCPVCSRISTFTGIRLYDYYNHDTEGKQQNRFKKCYLCYGFQKNYNAMIKPLLPIHSNISDETKSFESNQNIHTQKGPLMTQKIGTPLKDNKDANNEATVNSLSTSEISVSDISSKRDNDNNRNECSVESINYKNKLENIKHNTSPQEIINKESNAPNSFATLKNKNNISQRSDGLTLEGNISTVARTDSVGSEATSIETVHRNPVDIVISTSSTSNNKNHLEQIVENLKSKASNILTKDTNLSKTIMTKKLDYVDKYHKKVCNISKTNIPTNEQESKLISSTTSVDCPIVKPPDTDPKHIFVEIKGNAKYMPVDIDSPSATPLPIVTEKIKKDHANVLLPGESAASKGTNKTVIEKSTKKAYDVNTTKSNNNKTIDHTKPVKRSVTTRTSDIDLPSTLSNRKTNTLKDMPEKLKDDSTNRPRHIDNLFSGSTSVTTQKSSTNVHDVNMSITSFDNDISDHRVDSNTTKVKSLSDTTKAGRNSKEMSGRSAGENPIGKTPDENLPSVSKDKDHCTSKLSNITTDTPKNMPGDRNLSEESPAPNMAAKSKNDGTNQLKTADRLSDKSTLVASATKPSSGTEHDTILLKTSNYKEVSDHKVDRITTEIKSLSDTAKARRNSKEMSGRSAGENPIGKTPDENFPSVSKDKDHSTSKLSNITTDTPKNMPGDRNLSEESSAPNMAAKSKNDGTNQLKTADRLSDKSTLVASATKPSSGTEHDTILLKTSNYKEVSDHKVDRITTEIKSLSDTAKARRNSKEMSGRSAGENPIGKTPDENFPSVSKDKDHSTSKLSNITTDTPKNMPGDRNLSEESSAPNMAAKSKNDGTNQLETVDRLSDKSTLVASATKPSSGTEHDSILLKTSNYKEVSDHKVDRITTEIKSLSDTTKAGRNSKEMSSRFVSENPIGKTPDEKLPSLSKDKDHSSSKSGNITTETPKDMPGDRCLSVESLVPNIAAKSKNDGTNQLKTADRLSGRSTLVTSATKPSSGTEDDPILFKTLNYKEVSDHKVDRITTEIKSLSDTAKARRKSKETSSRSVSENPIGKTPVENLPSVSKHKDHSNSKLGNITTETPKDMPGDRCLSVESSVPNIAAKSKNDGTNQLKTADRLSGRSTLVTSATKPSSGTEHGTILVKTSNDKNISDHRVDRITTEVKSLSDTAKARRKSKETSSRSVSENPIGRTPDENLPSLSKDKDHSTSKLGNITTETLKDMPGDRCLSKESSVPNTAAKSKNDGTNQLKTADRLSGRSTLVTSATKPSSGMEHGTILVKTSNDKDISDHRVDMITTEVKSLSDTAKARRTSKETSSRSLSENPIGRTQGVHWPPKSKLDNLKANTSTAVSVDRCRNIYKNDSSDHLKRTGDELISKATSIQFSIKQPDQIVYDVEISKTSSNVDVSDHNIDNVHVPESKSRDTNVQDKQLIKGVHKRRVSSKLNNKDLCNTLQYDPKKIKISPSLVNPTFSKDSSGVVEETHPTQEKSLFNIHSKTNNDVSNSNNSILKEDYISTLRAGDKQDSGGISIGTQQSISRKRPNSTPSNNDEVDNARIEKKDERKDVFIASAHSNDKKNMDQKVDRVVTEANNFALEAENSNHPSSSFASVPTEAAKCRNNIPSAMSSKVAKLLPTDEDYGYKKTSEISQTNKRNIANDGTQTSPKRMMTNDVKFGTNDDVGNALSNECPKNNPTESHLETTTKKTIDDSSNVKHDRGNIKSDMKESRSKMRKWLLNEAIKNPFLDSTDVSVSNNNQTKNITSVKGQNDKLAENHTGEESKNENTNKAKDGHKPYEGSIIKKSSERQKQEHKISYKTSKNIKTLENDENRDRIRKVVGKDSAKGVAENSDIDSANGSVHVKENEGTRLVLNSLENRQEKSTTIIEAEAETLVLETSKKIMNSKILYECPICSCIFQDANIYLGHLKSDHNLSTPAVPETEELNNDSNQNDEAESVNKLNNSVSKTSSEVNAQRVQTTGISLGTEKYIYKCSICKDILDTKDSVRTHKREFHPKKKNLKIKRILVDCETRKQIMESNHTSDDVDYNNENKEATENEVFHKDTNIEGSKSSDNDKNNEIRSNMSKNSVVILSNEEAVDEQSSDVEQQSISIHKKNSQSNGKDCSTSDSNRNSPNGVACQAGVSDENEQSLSDKVYHGHEISNKQDNLHKIIDESDVNSVNKDSKNEKDIEVDEETRDGRREDNDEEQRHHRRKIKLNDENLIKHFQMRNRQLFDRVSFLQDKEKNINSADKSIPIGESGLQSVSTDNHENRTEEKTQTEAENNQQKSKINSDREHQGMEEGGASDSDKTVRLENYHWQPETMPLRRLTEEHLSQNIATAPNGCETTPNADDVQDNTRHTEYITIVIDSSDDEDAFKIDYKPDEKVDEKKYPSPLNIPETIKNAIELGDLELTAIDVLPPIINVNIQPIRIKVLNPKTINEQAAAKLCSEVSNDDNNKLNNDIVSSTRSSDGESMDNLIKDLTTLCKPNDTVYAPTSNENVSSSSVIQTVAMNTRDKISESTNKNRKETANPREDNARNIKVNTTETVSKSSSAERVKLLSPENSMGEKGNRHVESNKLLNINAEETRGQVNRLSDKDTLPTTCQRMRTDNEETTKNTLHSVGNNDDKVHTNNRLNTSILDLCINTHQKNGQNTDIVINEQKEKETSKTQNLKEFVRDKTSCEGNLKNLNEKKIISKFLSRFCSDMMEHLLEKWKSLSEDAESKNAFSKSARLLGDEIQKLDTLEKADVQLNCPVCSRISTFTGISLYDYYNHDTEGKQQNRFKKCYLCYGFQKNYNAMIKPLLPIHSNISDGPKSFESNQNIHTQKGPSMTQKIGTPLKDNKDANNEATVNSLSTSEISVSDISSKRDNDNNRNECSVESINNKNKLENMKHNTSPQESINKESIAPNNFATLENKNNISQRTDSLTLEGNISTVAKTDSVGSEATSIETLHRHPVDVVISTSSTSNNKNHLEQIVENLISKASNILTKDTNLGKTIMTKKIDNVDKYHKKVCNISKTNIPTNEQESQLISSSTSVDCPIVKPPVTDPKHIFVEIKGNAKYMPVDRDSRSPTPLPIVTEKIKKDHANVHQPGESAASEGTNKTVIEKSTSKAYDVNTTKSNNNETIDHTKPVKRSVTTRTSDIDLPSTLSNRIANTFKDMPVKLKDDSTNRPRQIDNLFSGSTSVTTQKSSTNVHDVNLSITSFDNDISDHREDSNTTKVKSLSDTTKAGRNSKEMSGRSAGENPIGKTPDENLPSVSKDKDHSTSKLSNITTDTPKNMPGDRCLSVESSVPYIAAKSKNDGTNQLKTADRLSDKSTLVTSATKPSSGTDDDTILFKTSNDKDISDHRVDRITTEVKSLSDTAKARRKSKETFSRSVSENPIGRTQGVHWPSKTKNKGDSNDKLGNIKANTSTAVSVDRCRNIYKNDSSDHLKRTGDELIKQPDQIVYDVEISKTSSNVDVSDHNIDNAHVPESKSRDTNLQDKQLSKGVHKRRVSSKFNNEDLCNTLQYDPKKIKIRPSLDNPTLSKDSSGVVEERHPTQEKSLFNIHSKTNNDVSNSNNSILKEDYISTLRAGDKQDSGGISIGTQDSISRKRPNSTPSNNDEVENARIEKKDEREDVFIASAHSNDKKIQIRDLDRVSKKTTMTAESVHSLVPKSNNNDTNLNISGVDFDAKTNILPVKASKRRTIDTSVFNIPPKIYKDQIGNTSVLSIHTKPEASKESIFTSIPEELKSKKSNHPVIIDPKDANTVSTNNLNKNTRVGIFLNDDASTKIDYDNMHQKVDRVVTEDNNFALEAENSNHPSSSFASIPTEAAKCRNNIPSAMSSKEIMAILLPTDEDDGYKKTSELSQTNKRNIANDGTQTSPKRMKTNDVKFGTNDDVGNALSNESPKNDIEEQCVVNEPLASVYSSCKNNPTESHLETTTKETIDDSSNVKHDRGNIKSDINENYSKLRKMLLCEVIKNPFLHSTDVSVSNNNQMKHITSVKGQNDKLAESHTDEESKNENTNKAKDGHKPYEASIINKSSERKKQENKISYKTSKNIKTLENDENRDRIKKVVGKDSAKGVAENSDVDSANGSVHVKENEGTRLVLNSLENRQEKSTTIIEAEAETLFLETSKKIMNSKILYECPICSCIFQDANIYLGHLKSDHNLITPAVPETVELDNKSNQNDEAESVNKLNNSVSKTNTEVNAQRVQTTGIPLGKEIYIYKCSTCSCIFQDVNIYLGHLKSDHNLSTPAVPETEEINNNSNQNDEAESVNKLNNSVFKTSTEVNAQRVQTNGIPLGKEKYTYKCSICKDTLDTYYSARTHKREFHPKKKFIKIYKRILVDCETRKQIMDSNHTSDDIDDNNENKEATENEVFDKDTNIEGSKSSDNDENNEIRSNMSKNSVVIISHEEAVDEQSSEVEQQSISDVLSSSPRKNNHEKNSQSNGKDRSTSDSNPNSPNGVAYQAGVSDENEQILSDKVYHGHEISNKQDNLHKIIDESDVNGVNKDSKNENDIEVDEETRDGCREDNDEEQRHHRRKVKLNDENLIKYVYKCKICGVKCRTKYACFRHREIKHFQMRNRQLFDRVLFLQEKEKNINSAGKSIPIGESGLQSVSTDNHENRTKEKTQTEAENNQQKSKIESDREHQERDYEGNKTNGDKLHINKNNSTEKLSNATESSSSTHNSHYFVKKLRAGISHLNQKGNKESRIKENQINNEIIHKINNNIDDRQSLNSTVSSNFPNEFSSLDAMDDNVDDNVQRKSKQKEDNTNDEQTVNDSETNNRQTGDKTTQNQSDQKIIQTNKLPACPDAYVLSCLECGYTTEICDGVIRHCQNHYNDVKDPTTRCTICQLNFGTDNFESHQSLHGKNVSIKVIKYSYKLLFSDWDKIFDDLPTDLVKDFRKRSIYKTNCIKMVVTENGPWEDSLYLCGECSTCVPPQELEQHLQDNCYFVSYPCPICKRCFTSLDMLVDHERNHSKSYRVVAFNNVKDKNFNCKLFKARKNQQDMMNEKVLATIYKCVCELCFATSNSFKIHFNECDFSAKIGVSCSKCTVPLHFEPTELENHEELHHSAKKCKLLVCHVTVNEEKVPDDDENDNDNTKNITVSQPKGILNNTAEMDIKRDLLKLDTTDSQD